MRSAVRATLTTITAFLVIGATIPTTVTAEARPSTPCAQWHATARAAGFTEAQWPTVARVMWRESRCRPTAHNRSGAAGLMQIMPMWRRRCGGGNLHSPAVNLRCARYIVRVQGWGAWRMRDHA